MAELVRIYRLRLSRGSSTSHVPDWRIYEDAEEFEADLLDALIEERARGRKTYQGEGWRACVSWLERILRRTTEGFGLNEVIGAEVLHDGQWVDIKPVLIPPMVDVTLPVISHG